MGALKNPRDGADGETRTLTPTARLGPVSIGPLCLNCITRVLMRNSYDERSDTSNRWVGLALAHPVQLQFRVQARAGNAEFYRGATAVAFASEQGLLQRTAFGLGKAFGKQLQRRRFLER